MPFPFGEFCHVVYESCKCGGPGVSCWFAGHGDSGACADSGGSSGVDVVRVLVPVRVEGDEMKRPTDVQLSALQLGGVIKALEPCWEPNAGQGGHVEGGDDRDDGCCHCCR